MYSLFAICLCLLFTFNQQPGRQRTGQRESGADEDDYAEPIDEGLVNGMLEHRLR